MKLSEVLAKRNPEQEERIQFFKNYKSTRKSHTFPSVSQNDIVNANYRKGEYAGSKGVHAGMGVNLLEKVLETRSKNYTDLMDDAEFGISLLDKTGNLHTSHYVGRLVSNVLRHLADQNEYVARDLRQRLEGYARNRPAEKQQ